MAKDKLKITMKDFFRTEFNETLDDLRTLYEDKCDECDDLYEELAEVKKETYKDKELAKLSKDEYEDLSHQVSELREKLNIACTLLANNVDMKRKDGTVIIPRTRYWREYISDLYKADTNEVFSRIVIGDEDDN